METEFKGGRIVPNLIKKEKEIELKTKMDKFPDMIDMIIYSDGAVAFSKASAEHFIYLYPDVVKQVKKELSRI